MAKIMLLSICTSVCAHVFAQTTNPTGTTMQSLQPSTTTVITTSPAPAVNDAAIASLVQKKIASDAVMVGTNIITITSSQGLVTISGTVSTQSQADAIVSDIKAIPGVKDVQSNVTISSLNSDNMNNMNNTPNSMGN